MRLLTFLLTCGLMFAAEPKPVPIEDRLAVQKLYSKLLALQVNAERTARQIDAAQAEIKAYTASVKAACEADKGKFLQQKDGDLVCAKAEKKD